MTEAVASTEVQALWSAGQGGYHTYRIPALIARDQQVLAFCEGRRDGGGDTGQIDLLLRRSDDGGRTWSEQSVVDHVAGFTSGNPVPVCDPRSGDVVLVFCRNPADQGETDICAGRAERTVWTKRSSDYGSTWGEAIEITEQVKLPRWTWYATGPGHGLTTRDGRMVVPANHIDGIQQDRWVDPYYSHLLLSDDGGHSWSLGATMTAGTNESSVAELADGRLLHNARRFRGDGLRAQAISHDGGLSHTATTSVADLVEPECQGAVLTDADGSVLYSGPAGRERKNLRLKLSRDDGQTFTPGLLIFPGPAAYSDLAIVGSEVLCLFESGLERPYERVQLARIPVASLRSGLASTSGLAAEREGNVGD